MFKIRKLTARECWRLMGFTDDAYDRAERAGVSRTQLYKQAGNSIVVDVLYYIFKNLFRGEERVSVNELFAGIGSQITALKRLGKEVEVVGISEIDTYALKSYEAIHGETRNYGDISKVEKLDYADFWTYSFPCTDISIAGKQRGLIQGETRSGLLYEVERLLQKAIDNKEAPKYLMLENVKNLASNKFAGQFNAWLKWLEERGYNNYWQVLNAKEYGVPQNRERVFVISIRDDVDDGTFTFPIPVDSTKRLIDVMEEGIDVQKDYGVHKEWVADLIEKMNKFDDGTIDKGKVIYQVINEYNRGTQHQQDALQSAYGVCRCIPAGTHGSTPHLLKTVYWSAEE